MVRARRRPDRAAAGDPTAATMLALRALARRHQQLTAEIDELDTLIGPLVAASPRPGRAVRGRGRHRRQLLVTAGDNPHGCAPRPPSPTCAASPRSRPRPGAPTATGSTAAATARPTPRSGASRSPAALGPPTRAYVARRTTEGLSKPEIIRCLKRYIAREVYTALLDPQPSSVPAITSTAPEESTWSARSAARTNDVDTDKR